MEEVLAKLEAAVDQARPFMEVLEEAEVVVEMKTVMTAFHLAVVVEEEVVVLKVSEKVLAAVSEAEDPVLVAAEEAEAEDLQEVVVAELDMEEKVMVVVDLVLLPVLEAVVAEAVGNLSEKAVVVDQAEVDMDQRKNTMAVLEVAVLEPSVAEEEAAAVNKVSEVAAVILQEAAAAVPWVLAAEAAEQAEEKEKPANGLPEVMPRSLLMYLMMHVGCLFRSLVGWRYLGSLSFNEENETQKDKGVQKTTCSHGAQAPGSSG